MWRRLVFYNVRIFFHFDQNMKFLKFASVSHCWIIKFKQKILEIQTFQKFEINLCTQLQSVFVRFGESIEFVNSGQLCASG